MSEVVLPEPPERDPFELALRLRPGLAGSLSRIVNQAPVSYQEGHRETFWVSDLVEGGAYTIQATLKLVSEHAYWYVDDSLEVSMEDLRKAAETFEGQIHPRITSAVGDIWDPGVDNDPRLTILHTAIKAADGYFGSQDEYPREVHPHSNQREIIYMDGRRQRPGSQSYLGVLAHEFQHAVHWNLDSGEDAWVNEGMSEVVKEMAGYRGSFINAYLQNTDVQLNFWPDDLRNSPAHYGASTLFLSYVVQHYGGFDNLKSLVQEQGDGINGVNAYLERYGKTFREVFEDWVVANYLDEPQGPYGYPDREVRVLDQEMLFVYGEKSGTVPQFAARYINLRPGQGDVLVRFQGGPEVSRFGTQCHSSQRCWWSNLGDSIDSTLTREFDLSGLDRATLEFWTWYQIEEDWDYAYVEVSTDGGATWQTLPGTRTTSENPIGNNFGYGYTGSSGDWVRETVDLSSFAGKKVLVRFEYVTDDAVSLDGFVVDDIAIPELGFFDDAEEDRGWQAEGFLRTDNRLAQAYAVQVIEQAADGSAQVRDMPLDSQNQGSMVIEGLGTRVETAVVVISPVTPGTFQPAPYTLAISPAPGP